MGRCCRLRMGVGGGSGYIIFVQTVYGAQALQFGVTTSFGSWCINKREHDKHVKSCHREDNNRVKVEDVWCVCVYYYTFLFIFICIEAQVVRWSTVQDSGFQSWLVSSAGQYTHRHDYEVGRETSKPNFMLPYCYAHLLHNVLSWGSRNHLRLKNDHQLRAWEVLLSFQFYTSNYWS